jgi:hypothetical protein
LKILAQAKPLTLDQAILISGRLKAQRLARQILALHPIIINYDKRIGELFASHPDAKIFRSFPGAGPILAPRLLCAFGSDRSRWKHSLDIATFSGIAPVIMRSGKNCQGHWRWACPKFLRQTFREFAGSSTLFSPWAKAFYRNMVDRGKSHHAAIRALAFKWIRILYPCWKAHLC